MDGQIRIGTELETKSFEAQIKNLENKLETMIKTLESEAEIPVHLRMSDEERIQLENDIERTKNQIISLQQKMSDKKPSENMSRNLKKSANNMKRFALNLLSVGSLLAVVSKASSAYLSTNEQLANKLQSVWIGLGSLLAPIIETISNILLKGIGYLNEFIKALTGVDLIAKANAKALEKQAKAQKDLNKQTQQYDFDVVRTQQSTSSSSSSTGSSGLIEIPELNQGIVKKLQDIAKWLRENKELVLGVGVALVTAFGAKKIAELLGSASAGTGLLGLANTLALIGTTVIVTIAVKGVIDAAKEMKKLKRETDANLEGFEDLAVEEKKVHDGLNNLIADENASQEQISKATDALYRSTKTSRAHFDHLNESIAGTSWIVDIFTGTTKKLRKEQELEYEAISNVTEGMYQNFEAGKLNEDQARKLIEMLLNQITMAEELGLETDILREKLGKVAKEYKIDIYGEFYDNISSKVNDLVTKVGGALNNLFKNAGLDKTLKNVFEALLPDSFRFGSDVYSKTKGTFDAIKNFGKQLGFAKGGIVTQPTRALIGEAGYPEAVVPMTSDYLSTLASAIGQYSGGNGTTNVYLDGRLIQRQINNKQNKINFATNS